MTHCNTTQNASPTGEVILVDPEIIRQVRELTRLAWGAKRIASELGLARNTVRRYQRLPVDVKAAQTRPRRRCLTEAAQQEAVRMLDSEAEGNAIVIQRLLAQQGHDASVRTVQRAVMSERSAQRQRQAATVRFETAPGSQTQIDFGEKRVRIGGQTERVSFFVAVLGYSRRTFVRAFLSQRIDDWREGLAAAFAHFGGTTQGILIDNPKAMVLHHKSTTQVTLHPAFAAFCTDWSLAVRACAPYRARTKGKVESGVKYVKRNALAGLSFTSFGALCAHLASWMEMADNRRHGTLGDIPARLFEKHEKSTLRSLPSSKLRTRDRRLLRKVANDCLVDVDTIRYSVPHRFVGTRVEVSVGDERVTIFSGAELIANHIRGFEPRSRIINQTHYDGLLRRPSAYRATPEPTTVEKPNETPDTMARNLLASYVEILGGTQ